MTQILNAWDWPKIRTALNELQFIVTSDGEVAIGWSNKEEGGFAVLKRMPDILVKSILEAHSPGREKKS